MLTLLWLDEDDRSTIHLFQLIRNPGKTNHCNDKSLHYYDNDDWPATNSKIVYNGKKIRNASITGAKIPPVL